MVVIKMRKKYIIIIIFLIFSLLIVPKNVYAQQEEEFPERFLKLSYVEHNYVQEHEQVYEYRVVYTAPYRISSDVSRYWYVIYHNYADGFNREVSVTRNSYSLSLVRRQPDYTELHFRITLLKDLVNSRYPDGDVTQFFVADSAMYVKDEEDLYEKGFNDGVKSVLYKPYSLLLDWTVPFITLIIISGIYFGYKREWFKND